MPGHPRTPTQLCLRTLLPLLPIAVASAVLLARLSDMSLAGNTPAHLHHRSCAALLQAPHPAEHAATPEHPALAHKLATD